MGIGIKELIIILVIVLLLFGTRRLKSLGTDLGAAIKGFRKSMEDEDQHTLEQRQQSSSNEPQAGVQEEGAHVDAQHGDIGKAGQQPPVDPARKP